MVSSPISHFTKRQHCCYLILFSRARATSSSSWYYIPTETEPASQLSFLYTLPQSLTESFLCQETILHTYFVWQSRRYFMPWEDETISITKRTSTGSRFKLSTPSNGRAGYPLPHHYGYMGPTRSVNISFIKNFRNVS